MGRWSNQMGILIKQSRKLPDETEQLGNLEARFLVKTDTSGEYATENLFQATTEMLLNCSTRIEPHLVHCT